MATGGDCILQQLRDQGAPIPPEAIEPPSSHPDIDRWFMHAFAELSTERDFGMGMGPIPASKIREHAREAGLDRDATRTFVDVIRALDREALAIERARVEAEQKTPRGG